MSLPPSRLVETGPGTITSNPSVKILPRPSRESWDSLKRASAPNLWEMEFTYNFGSRGLFGHTVKPYLVAGGGGITTNMTNGDAFVLNNTFIDVPGVSPATLAGRSGERHSAKHSARR